MNRNEIINKFKKAKTSLERKTLVINLFEGFGYPRNRDGVEDFKNYLENSLPGIDNHIGKSNIVKGNGITETSEDYLRLNS